LNRLGVFITFEGIDGTGKSTQLRLLAEWLRRQGYKPRLTREPGGTRIGEQIRKILLASQNSELTGLTELLLMYAAREQHLREVVRPALDRGEVVLSDRFNDASFAYQGCGRQLGPATVDSLDRLVCGATQPDLTFILDLSVRTALLRASKRDGHKPHQRFESQGARFHERVRQGYLRIVEEEPQRVRLIKADAPADEVHRQIRDEVSAFLAEREAPAKSKVRKRKQPNKTGSRAWKGDA
jgi:dTMP kinase